MRYHNPVIPGFYPDQHFKKEMTIILLQAPLSFSPVYPSFIRRFGELEANRSLPDTKKPAGFGKHPLFEGYLCPDNPLQSS